MLIQERPESHGESREAWRRALDAFLRDCGYYARALDDQPLEPARVAEDLVAVISASEETLDLRFPFVNVGFEAPISGFGFSIERGASATPGTPGRGASSPSSRLLRRRDQEALDRTAALWCLRCEVRVPALPIGKLFLRDTRPVDPRRGSWGGDADLEELFFALAMFDWSRGPADLDGLPSHHPPLAVLAPTIRSSHPWSWFEGVGSADPMDLPEIEEDEHGEPLPVVSIRLDRSLAQSLVDGCTSHPDWRWDGTGGHAAALVPSME